MSANSAEPPANDAEFQGILKRVYSGMAPGWNAVFDDPRHGVRAAFEAGLAAALGATPAAELEPAPENVLAAFKYARPTEIKFVVVGQDPYPNDASGLAFSKPGKRVADSYRTIHKSLVEDGLAFDPEPRTSDLRGWAVQGGLLLNAWLTTARGRSGAHGREWADCKFAKCLVSALAQQAAERGQTLVFMLWGDKAQKLARPCITAATRLAGLPPHEILEWSHPSPLADNRIAKADPARGFARCGHFKRANALLGAGREILWDPALPSHVFTDGGCKANGGKSKTGEPADASFAAHVVGGPANATSVSGRVEPYPYRLVSGASPELGFEPDYDAEEVAPTNNRGEYLAACWGLLVLLRGGAAGRCELITDCELFVNTMTKWLAGWRAKGVAEQKKNYDLVAIAEALAAALRGRVPELVFTHVRAAHDTRRPPDSAPPRERMLWGGNHTVDSLCDAVIGAKSDPRVVPEAERDYGVRVDARAPALRRLG